MINPLIDRNDLVLVFLLLLVVLVRCDDAYISREILRIILAKKSMKFKIQKYNLKVRQYYKSYQLTIFVLGEIARLKMVRVYC